MKNLIFVFLLILLIGSIVFAQQTRFVSPIDEQKDQNRFIEKADQLTRDANDFIERKDPRININSLFYINNVSPNRFRNINLVSGTNVNIVPDVLNHSIIINSNDERGEWVTLGLKDPTGFPLKTETPITINFTDGNRTLSVSPSGTDFNFFIKGNQFIKTSVETFTATDDEGAHYFYYDSTGNLTENVTPTASEIEDIIRNNPLVAVIYWNTTDNNAIYFTGVNELHGTQMDGETHKYLHFTRGSIFLSGFAVGDVNADNGGDANSDAQLSVADGRFEDEDIEMEINDGSPQTLSVPAEIPIFYKSGSALWKKITATTFVISTTGTGRAAYNLNTAGTWSVVEVTNNKFTLSHIFATNNNVEPIIIVMGENEYSTKADARIGAVTELNDITTAGLGFQEFVPIATILFQTKDTYSNAVKSQIVSTEAGEDFVDWRFQELSPSVTPSSHSNLTGLTNDDHLQYLRTDGSRPLTGAWDANNDITGITQLVVDSLTLNSNTIKSSTTLDFEGTQQFRYAVTSADTDLVFVCEGTTNTGEWHWSEDEDYFKYFDDILMNMAENIYFRDTELGFNSPSDGEIKLFSDEKFTVDANTVFVGDINANKNINADANINIGVNQRLNFTDENKVVKTCQFFDGNIFVLRGSGGC